jgi:hypothetical protein
LVSAAGDHLGWWPGRLSERDAVADLAGIGLGVALAASGAGDRWAASFRKQQLLPLSHAPPQLPYHRVAVNVGRGTQR